MRRFSTAFGVVALLVLAAVPVAGAPPSGGCGAEASGWQVVTYAEWLEATEEAIGRELTEEEEADIVAGLAADDRNEDGLVCLKPFYPSGNTPAFDPGFFNFKDNTAAVGD